MCVCVFEMCYGCLNVWCVCVNVVCLYGSCKKGLAPEK